MLFKGLHQMLGKTATQQESAKHPHATPIESAATLLAPARRQDYLKNIKSLLHLPPKLYDTLYYKVIERFAEFVQSLPETQHGAFANNGDFLNHGLDRASRALTLILSYFFPEEQSFHSATSEQALWIYAVFTAGLLLDIGKLAVKYQITLCNKDSTAIKEWLPYSGSMVGQAKYYKFTYVKQNRDHLRRLITGLLARQLLTETDQSGDGTTTVGGFNWIASDPVVLESWLNMLYGETRNVTSYLTVLPYADQLAIENNLAHERAANLGKNALFGTGLFDTTKDNPLAELAAGQALHEWLRQNIGNGTVAINNEDSAIHRTEEGLMVSLDDLINRFTKENPQHQNNTQVIKTQFMQLMELYNIPVSQLAREYVLLKGGVISTHFRNWLFIYKPEFLIQLGQQIPLNPNIAKVPVTTVSADPIHTPTEPTQQHNAKLQHR